GSAAGASIGAAGTGGGGGGGSSGGGGPSDATVARIVAGVLSRLVDRVEVEARHQASREAAVAAVMQRIVWMVSRSAAREQLGVRRPGRRRLGRGGSDTGQTQPRGSPGASGALSAVTESGLQGDVVLSAVGVSGGDQGWRQRQRRRWLLEPGGCGGRETLGAVRGRGRATRGRGRAAVGRSLHSGGPLSELPDGRMSSDDRQIRGVLSRLVTDVVAAARAERIKQSIQMVMDRMISKLEAAAEGRRRRRRHRFQASQPAAAAAQDSQDAAVQVATDRDGEHEPAITAAANDTIKSVVPGGVVGPMGRPAKLTTHGSVDPWLNGPVPVFARGKMLSPSAGVKRRRRLMMSEEHGTGKHVTHGTLASDTNVREAAVVCVGAGGTRGLGGDGTDGAEGRSDYTASASASAAPAESGQNNIGAATAVRISRRRGRPRLRPADEDEDDGEPATGSMAADDAAVAGDGAVDPAVIEAQWSGRWSEPRVLRAASRLALAGAELGGPSLRRAVRQLLRVDGFRMLRWLRTWREVALAAEPGALTATSDSTPGTAERSQPCGFSYTELLLSALTDESPNSAGSSGDQIADGGAISATSAAVRAVDAAVVIPTVWMPTTTGAGAVASLGGEGSIIATASVAAAATHDATIREDATDAAPGSHSAPGSASVATPSGAGEGLQQPPPPPPPPPARSPAPVPNDDVPRLWRKMYDNAIEAVISAGPGGGLQQLLSGAVVSNGAAPSMEEPAAVVRAAAAVPVDSAVGPAFGVHVLREVGPAQLLAHAALSHVVYAAAEAAAAAGAAAPDPLAAAQPSTTPTPAACTSRSGLAGVAAGAVTPSAPIMRSGDVAVAGGGITSALLLESDERPLSRALTDGDLMASYSPPGLSEGVNDTVIRRPAPDAQPGSLDAGQSKPGVSEFGLRVTGGSGKTDTAVASSAADATGAATGAAAVAIRPASGSASEAAASPAEVTAIAPTYESGTALNAACVTGGTGSSAAGAADVTSIKISNGPPAPPARHGAGFGRVTMAPGGRRVGEGVPPPPSPLPPRSPIQDRTQLPLQPLLSPLQPLIDPSAPSAGSNSSRVSSAAEAAGASCAFAAGYRAPLPVGTAPPTAAPLRTASAPALGPSAPILPNQAVAAASTSVPTPVLWRPVLQGSQNRGALLPGETAKRKQRPVSSLPLAVCMACLEALPGEVEAGRGIATHGSESAGSAWCCEGPCRRGFHFGCARPTKIDKYEQAKTICQQCFRDAHPCSICGRDATDGSETSPGLVKCSLAACGRWYHAECAVAHPLTKVIAGGSGGSGGGSGGRGRGRGRGGPATAAVAVPLATKFRCPLHTCAVCSGSGEGAAIMACVRCATAYHAKCKPQDAELLAKKLLLCPACCNIRTAGRSITHLQQQQQEQLQGGGAKRPRL
ncbi:hypothetical protein Vretimale_2418, partial [Volvox reticuliferus]